ncbi:MAG TPA: GNAT family N-acetyltransferase [Chitinophagaceae bacterium]|jgi:GNAT superfamily N-acetyltransferase|nr:GNAT family N-acetyltransferase [Chitinophagaceae bacterium]
MHINLVRYQPTYDSAIAHLEGSSVQGNGIQLKILKEHFLDRSIVFPKTFPCLALNEHGEVIGTSVGAETKLVINGIIYPSGFVLDAKVHPSYRNKGIGRQLAQQQKEWFNQEGWEKNFTTAKLSNAAVVKLSAKAIGKIFLTPFVYLTIPTNTRISSDFRASGTKKFSVRLFGKASLPLRYHTTFPGGLGIFHTWMVYRIKVEKISWLYRLGLGCIEKMFPNRYAVLPKEKEVMEFATLFNHTEENIGGINEVMEHLNGEGIRFLLVCCRKGDSMYDHLKKYSINTYAYNMITDFPLYEKDEIALDVRCL